MSKVKILWSGITGRTGKEAIEIAKESELFEIVAGVCRSDNDYYNYDELDNIVEEFDVIVDFSHKDSFNKILNYALKVRKPIIIGTSGLSDEQMNDFEKASNIIPVFRGDNFRFDVKQFIDQVVEYAKTCNNDNIELVETHYKTKKVPSETAKVVAKRVLDETGKIVNIKSLLEYDDLINDWRVGDLHCRVIGFKELAEDVLHIALMMKDKKADGIYDLDRLFKERDEMTDKEFMDIAIELSKKAYYPYGAIIVRDKQIIGRSDADVTVSKSGFSHAELRAIEDAMPLLGGHLCAEGGKGATIYSSCEPCAMCMGAILYSGIERLVYGATLEDSKECVNEILASSKDIASICSNRNIEIIPEVQKAEAVKVLKKWKSEN